MSRVFWGILAASLLFTTFNSSDPELNQEAQTLLSMIESNEESEAFLYLLGIDAPEGIDPIEFARELMKEPYITPNTKKENTDSRIKRPDSPLFCGIREEKCLTTLFNTNFDIEKIRLDNKTLLSRAEKFHSYNEYRTLTKPSPFAIMPNFSILQFATRVEILNAISKYREGEVESALDILLNQIALFRRAMILQDTLIGKTIVIATTSEITEFASIMLSQSPMDKGVKISKLSAEEKNYSKVAAREFGIQRFNHLSVWPQPKNIGDSVARKLGGYFYKANMTSNVTARQYFQEAKLAQLTPKEFAETVQVDYGTTDSGLPLENAMGNYFLSFEASLKSYITRIQNLDATIELFNHRFYEKRDFEIATNPYYPTEPLGIQENQVCFRGPAKYSGIRCLMTRINSSQ